MLNIHVNFHKYLSKLYQAVVVLEVGNILELINSIKSANGGFRMLLYPIPDQIKAKLQRNQI